MAKIFPFRALRYNQAEAPLNQVVTQPYDKITPAMQSAYYSASPYNLVRIILGKAETSDNASQNVYIRATSHFRDWRQTGVLQQDDKQSIYQYIQQFVAPGGKQETERRGFIALGKLEEYADGVVFRHEQTLAKPKADRLDLLRATRAHFGQIFMLYSDLEGQIDCALQDASTAAKPDMEVLDEYGVRHQVRRLQDPAVIARVQDGMRDKKLIIADGHHRYETALNYRNEQRKERTGQGEHTLAPYEMAMMTFFNMDAPGLTILPTHRLVFGLSGFSAEAFRETTRKQYSVEEVDPALDAARASVILRQAGRTGIALLVVAANRAFLVDRPRNADNEMLRGLSLRQQSLDVAHLHKCLLEGVLQLSEESIRNQENIRYLRDSEEALRQVRDGEADVAFLMNPVSMKQVRDIAFSGEVLPQKSTDFYPKLLSGLAIYALE